MKTGWSSALFLLLAGAAPAAAQSTGAPKAGGHAVRPSPSSPGEALSSLSLSAALTQNDSQHVRAGVDWRIFEEAAQADGSHRLVAESKDAAPTFSLPDGAYIVHAAFGLAGVTKRIAIEGHNVSERLVLNAGGLKLVDKLGDAQIPPQRLSISIYVPERGNSEAKLVLANAKANETLCLPEGTYHVVSTLLDTSQGAQGGNNATNSVVTAD
jgi:hypothetical protein